MKTRTISLFRNQALLALAMVLLLSLTTGCNGGIFCTKGKGELVTVELDLPTITGFDNASAADVVLTQGETQSIKVTAQQNVIDRLKREVKNGTWNADIDGCIANHKDILIEITLPTLAFAGISGTGTVTATNRFTDLDDVTLSIAGSGDMILDLDANRIDASISGSGSYDLDLTAQTLNTTTSGSGNFRLSGSATNFSNVVSGSGKCQAFDMETQYTDIRVSGSGDVETRVSDVLDVVISGSGNVYYKGQPAITITVSGSGSLINAN